MTTSQVILANATTTVVTEVKKVLSVNAFGNAGSESSDAIWILTSAFIIFTMQSGFGLLEAGRFHSNVWWDVLF